MTTTKNHQKQQHVLPMAAAAAATASPPWPVRTKLLLCAALGFTLGAVATASLMTSSFSSSYAAAALLMSRGGGGSGGGGAGGLGGVRFVFPPSAARNDAVQDRRPPPKQAGAAAVPPAAAIRRPVSEPPPPAAGTDMPPPPAAPPTGIATVATPLPPAPPAVIASASTPPTPPAPPGVVGEMKGPGAPPSSGGNSGGTAIGDGDDEEQLMARAAAAPREVPVGRAPKVAFLFLTRWDLPMAPLWDMFFRGHRGLYNVYVHSDPSFNGSDPPESAFYRRRIPSKEVKWGQMSMVEAERRLVAQALVDDHANARFVLLSESHVPLFDFPTVYSYLLNSTQVFLESYDQPGATGRGRYSRHMSPVVAAWQWRKGSQWFDMDRALAADVVADAVYFPLFRRFCRRNCYADEHYLPTFLHIRRPPGAGANRSLTWVDWSRGGPHPARFTRMEVTVDFLRWLRGGAGGTCTYNGRTTTVCFLFARKFLPNSLTRFLRFAPKVMGFG